MRVILAVILLTSVAAYANNDLDCFFWGNRCGYSRSYGLFGNCSAEEQQNGLQRVDSAMDQVLQDRSFTSATQFREAVRSARQNPDPTARLGGYFRVAGLNVADDQAAVKLFSGQIDESVKSHLVREYGLDEAQATRVVRAVQTAVLGQRE